MIDRPVTKPTKPPDKTPPKPPKKPPGRPKISSAEKGDDAIYREASKLLEKWDPEIVLRAATLHARRKRMTNAAYVFNALEKDTEETAKKFREAEVAAAKNPTPTRATPEMSLAHMIRQGYSQQQYQNEINFSKQYNARYLASYKEVQKVQHMSYINRWCLFTLSSCLFSKSLLFVP